VHTDALIRTAARFATSLGATESAALATDTAQPRAAELRMLTQLTGLTFTGSDARFRSGRIYELAGASRIVVTGVGLEHVTGAGRKAQAHVGGNVVLAVVVGQLDVERAKTAGPSLTRRPIAATAEPEANPTRAKQAGPTIGGNRPILARIARPTSASVDAGRRDLERTLGIRGQACLVGITALGRLVVAGTLRTERLPVRRIVDAAPAIFHDQRTLWVGVAARRSVVLRAASRQAQANCCPQAKRSRQAKHREHLEPRTRSHHRLD